MSKIDIRKGTNKVKITLPENDKGFYIYALKNESKNYHGKVIKR